MEREQTRIAKFSRFIDGSTKRINLMEGGSGSGKSRSLAIHFARRLVGDPRTLTLACFRKTRPSVKVSCYKLITDLLRAWGFTLQSKTAPARPGVPVVYEDRTDLTLTCNGVTIRFGGIDDPEKIKSTDFDEVWIEEATELDVNDFNTINRCTRGGKIDKLWCSYNPVDSFAWPVLLARSGDPDVAYMHSTMDDNPFLPDAVRAEIEKYKTLDDQLYRIYRLGEPGVLENVIYSNYDIVGMEMWPIGLQERINEPDARGLDFGYETCALIDVWVRDGRPYERERLYSGGMHAGAIIAWMQENGLDPSIPIIADSARPDEIAQLCEAGYNCLPCTKGKNSVISGIDFCRRLRPVVDAASENLKKEYRSYKRQRTKDGHVLDQPVKAFDHLMDSKRYVEVYLKPMFGLVDEAAAGPSDDELSSVVPESRVPDDILSYNDDMY